jgi:hypothetical protein
MAMVKQMSQTVRLFLTLALVGLALTTPKARAASVLENISEIRKFFGLDQYEYRNELGNLKIAVIDNGFEGFDTAKGQLPSSAELVMAYPKDMIAKYNLGDPDYVQPPIATEHGKMMAQIVWGVTGANSQGPKFYLLNGNGITNFRRAVRYAIEKKVDLILYSQNRECCGNFDGAGFLNDIVNQATQAGIVWINAAGNYGGHVFNGTLQSIGSDNRVSFNQTTELRLKSRLDENKAQIILLWNSNATEEDSGTDQDLDLFVYDENNNEVAKSELKQVLKKEGLKDGETFLARERINYEFSKNRNGYYRIVVKAKSRNFTSSSRVRIVVIPERPPVQDNEKKKMVDAIEFLDATKGEEIMVPADNPNVITVGDLAPFSAVGPTLDGRVKPEVVLENSIASFSNGQSSTGTSNAAAYFTGVVAVLKSYAPNLTRQHIINFPRKRPSSLGASIRKTPFTEVVAQHGEIFNSVEQMLDESPILAGRYADGRYVIGIRKDPAQVLQGLCANNYSSNDQKMEYYLAISGNYDRQGNSLGNSLRCYNRRVPSQENDQSPYPWEQAGVSSGAFVEIRQVYFSGTNFPSQGVWKTPSPQDLYRY